MAKRRMQTIYKATDGKDRDRQHMTTTSQRGIYVKWFTIDIIEV